MHACPEKTIVFIVFALVVLTSCQDQPQQQQAVAPEPAVVTVPISANQEAAIAKKQEPAITEKQETAIAEKQKAAIAAKQKTATTEKQETAIAEKQKTAITEKQKTAITEKQKTAITEKQKTATTEKQKTGIAEKQKAATAGKQETVKSTQKDAAPTGKPAVASPLSQPEEKPVVSEPGEPKFYSSKGKTDPFMPLIRTEQKAVAGTAAREKKPQRVLTPLEKLDLSQIRLVAVVTAESGNLAMVEETSGKGYVVRIGTYIGKNSGRVEKILRDRIVIKEIVKNFRGDTVPRSSEMKLHKQEIEG